MRRGVAGLLLAMGFYLAFLLAELPAARLLGWLPLPAGLSLSGVSGTLWQGQAAALSWRGWQVRALSWRLHLGPLLLGRPTLALSLADAAGLSGEAQLSWRGHWQIRALDLQAPAAALLAARPQPWPVTVSGKVRLQVAEAAFEPAGCLAMAGQLRWSRAMLGTPLGELQLAEPVAQLDCLQGRLVAEVQQRSTQLSLQGRGELEPRGEYRFRGSLQPGAELSPQMAQLLGQLGPRDSQGQIRLTLQGRF